MVDLKVFSLTLDIGKITVATCDRQLIYLALPNNEAVLFKWLKKHFPQLTYNITKKNNLLEKQLIEYLEGQRTEFEVPYRLLGTPFQLRVWRELVKIPYGQVISYKEIGQKIGYQRGYQAIGQAIGSNPLSLIVPCHRVIGSTGSLTGYAGGLELKRILLSLEKNNCNN